MKSFFVLTLFWGLTTGLLAQSQVYYFNFRKGIERTNTDTIQRQTIVSVEGVIAQGIAIDTEHGKMYWTDWVSDKIRRANLDGTDIEDVITTGLQLPEGIAIDIGAKKLYWTDSGTNKIHRANTDGTNIEDVIVYSTGVNLGGITIDEKNQKIYWADWGAGASRGRILSANTDGSNQKTLVDIHNAILKGIDLDLVEGKIYWTDCGYSKIQRANLNGTQVEDLVTAGIGSPNSLGVDQINGKVYWTDPAFPRVKRANLDGTSVEDIVSDTLQSPTALAIRGCSGKGADCWTTSVDDLQSDPFISVGPVPVEDVLVISRLEKQDRILISDLLGRRITLPVSDRGNMEISLEQMSSGVLLVSVFRGERVVFSRKILKY